MKNNIKETGPPSNTEPEPLGNNMLNSEQTVTSVGNLTTYSVTNKKVKKQATVETFIDASNCKLTTFQHIPLLGVFYVKTTLHAYLKVGNTTAIEGVSTMYKKPTVVCINASLQQDQPNIVKVRFKKTKLVFLK
jgi:hypothetical protein